MLNGLIATVAFSRPKAMYYWAVFSFDKIFSSLFKLIYADPRPYMMDSAIKPISCSKSFGNPSGHSTASSMITIVLFFDLFHGRSKTGNGRLFFKSWQYMFGMILALFWAASIPYSRFLMGVHSLDQIVYGSSIGIVSGFFMHF